MLARLSAEDPMIRVVTRSRASRGIIVIIPGHGSVASSSVISTAPPSSWRGVT